jgi:hypothetical protein
VYLASIVVQSDHRGVRDTPRRPGAWTLVACAIGLLAVRCTHHEPDPDEARERAIVPPPGPAREPIHRAPDDDVGAALEPCPPDFRAMSVRAVRAKTWPSKTCFAIVGHLTATYAVGPVCKLRPMAEGAPAAGESSSTPPSREFPGCPRGWVLTDLADPIIVLEETRPSRPFIRVRGAPTTRRWMDALLACNRDSGGKAIMPAPTRFALPVAFRMADIPRLNASLAGVTVGVFGGVQSCCGMADTPDDFGSMTITHFCRVDAPDGGTRGE